MLVRCMSVAYFLKIRVINGIDIFHFMIFGKILDFFTVKV